MAAFLTCTVLFFFQVNEGTNVVLQHNIVAGYERVAYRIDGEPCPGNENDLTKVKVDISAKFPMLAWTVKLITSGYISPVCTLNAQIEETRCRTEVLKDPPLPDFCLCRLFEREWELDSQRGSRRCVRSLSEQRRFARLQPHPGLLRLEELWPRHLLPGFNTELLPFLTLTLIWTRQRSDLIWLHQEGTMCRCVS